MTQDVEKRWRDPRTFRSAAWYAAVVIALALLTMFGVVAWSAAFGGDCAPDEFAVCTEPARSILLFGPAAILLLGGLGAFVQAYRVWRSGGRWPIWHGAGWALFVLMVMYAGVSAAVATP